MRSAAKFLFAVPAFLSQRSLALMTSAAANSITLNDGRQHPLVGYGTYKVGFVPASASSAVTEAAVGDAAKAPEVTAAECVEVALDVGYRFLDCAEFYGNEAEVGKAIAKSGVPREELFLASKCWTTTIHKGPEAVQAQLEKTLKDLGVDYIDLYCIHWPVPGKHVAAYQQLEKAQAAGLVRSLGVSNYAVEDYVELMESATVVPAINQIEINPFLHRSKTIAFFESKGVKLQRMAENMRVFDFELDADDMSKLDALTTPEAFANFEALYAKCVIRDTPDAGRTELVRTKLTVD